MMQEFVSVKGRGPGRGNAPSRGGWVPHDWRPRPPHDPVTGSYRRDATKRSITMESIPALEPVTPAKPVAPYLGGKRNLARRLCSLIEATPHTVYAEPFVGMGGVFLRRQARPRAEVINDWSEEVATFFRVLQRHYQALLDMIRWQITTRREFERLSRTDPATLTDLERAARFLYLQRCAFGGKPVSQNFGVSTDRPGRFDLNKLAPLLEAVHERLSGVVIERMRYADFIARYDRPGMLFYLDPPYWGGETDYGKGMFGRGDFERLADQLAGIKGRFLLSINDTPETRQIFGRFEREEVRHHFSAAAGRSTPARELIVSGG